MNVLFLCAGNSCRSIIAEALLREQRSEGVTVQSAGSHPTGVVNPRALAVLRKAGISTEGLSSKSWDTLAIKPDVVITLCADAEGEPCPIYFGDVIRSHWGMPDPAKALGSEEDIERAFSTTLLILKARIDLLRTIIAGQMPDQGSALSGVSREIFKQSIDRIMDA